MKNNTDSYFSQSNLWTEQIAPYQEQVLADILSILPSDITSILDVGCGNGLITNQLPESLKVVGLDRSEEALKYVQKETIVGDILNLPLEDQSFDLVICNDVLEHLTTKEREQALKELARVSRKYILITVPFLEDLNQGMTKCADCGKYYHINHHLASFDLDTTGKFFDNFNYHCIRQILSGDIWYGEPPEIVLTRRLLSDLAPTETPVCLHCGSQKIMPSQDSNDVVAPLIAKLCLNNPSLLDWHNRRTECISLFSQVDIINNIAPDNLTEGFIDQNNHEVYVTSEVVNNNEIFFNKKEIYYHTFLPRISRLPYYYVNTVSLDNKGIKLAAGQNLLLGFFCGSNEEKINFNFSGFAHEQSTIVITKYDDLQGYILPVTKQINHQFFISLEFPFSLSSYGFLLEISVLEGNISITDATLKNVKFDQVTVYHDQERKARFWRIIGDPQNIQNIIDISLPIYGEAIIAQGWQNQIQIRKTNPIVNYSVLENQANTDFSYLSILSQEIRNKDKLNINIQHQNQQLQNQNQQLQNQNQQLQNQNQQLQNQNQQLQNQNQQLQNQEQQLQNQNQQLQNQNQQLQNQEQQLQHQNQQLQNQNQQLQHQEQQLQNILENLSQEIKQKNHLINQLQTKYEKTLLRRIRRKILSFGLGRYLSFENFKQQILNSIEPNVIDTKWAELRAKNKLFLMICHDQNIDRRIIQQATTLIENGWQGKIICLSFDNEDHLEEYEDISIHRIGLAKIVPDCPVYWRYQNRQRLINWWGRSFPLLSKINWFYYKVQSRLEYQGTHSGYPLPFDFIFYITAKHYPADIIIAHDLPALKAAHKIAKEWKAYLGYDAHELYYEQNVFSEKKKKFMRQTEEELIKECDIVFTVNLSIADEMASRYQIETPNVLLNAIDPPQDFDQEFLSNNLRDYFKLAKDQKILLFQGGLEKNRNLENLVQAMSHVKVSNLVLVFMGNGSLKKTLESLARKYDLTTKVFFKEAVPQAELIYWTASADIGIIPYPHVDLNTYYCTPNKLFEFIQAQLPIIANNSPELKRFVHDNGFGKVGSMKNPRQIARLIDDFVTDDQAIEKAQENLSNNFHKFSWSCEKLNYLKQLKILSLK
jgi:glycosyltransferase involved in cell wall biosynthesis/SAM-dependent methyltransferase/flagellar biosynthesis GTPase FlhF